jgi:hypothetical protein
MKKEIFIDVNGTQVLDLTPDHERALALVDLSIVQRLAKLLPTSNLSNIKNTLVDKITFQCHTLEDLVETLEEEVAFHKTVNLLKAYEGLKEEYDRKPNLSLEDMGFEKSTEE